MNPNNTNQTKGNRPSKNNNGAGRAPRQNPARGQTGKPKRNQEASAAARPQQGNSVLAKTQIRRGEVQRAQRRTSENVNAVASQHVIDVPVNKSVYNGYGGQQFTLNMQKTIPRIDGPILRVIPIGGVGEMGIGKNMSAIEYENDIIIIDMGFLFPGADYPGINYIVPDITYLEERKHKIRGIVFTHGHLDHIGAVRHLLHRLPAPVYGSKFTLGMVEKMMEESDTPYRPAYNILNPETHERVQLGDSFSIELVRVNHSIPDSTAVVVRTPLGVVINSGDWRIEENPVDGRQFDFERLEQISREEGVLLFMNESTNCESAGTHLHGEYEIGQTFSNIIDQYKNSRLIVSTFSSQIHRIQMILESAAKHGRKVAFAGYSMLQNMEVALRSNVIKVPKDVIMRMDDIVKLPDSKVIVVCTGSQGEFSAVLNRMVNGSHKHIKVKRTDVVVLSSNPIPGNEKYVVRTVDGLMREGADVLQNAHNHLHNAGPLHLSGHGYYDDHVRLLGVIKPKYYMPIHGEFHMLAHNAQLAERDGGIKRENIFVCDAGDVVQFDQNGMARKAGRVPAGGVMYDDSGDVVSEVVLKDRIHMASEGMFVVVLTLSKQTGRLLTSPDIISRGFIYLRDSEELMNTIRSYLKQKVARGFGGRRGDMDEMKKELKDEITHILYDQTRRTPIVIPVINEISGSGSAPQPAAEPAPMPFRAPAPQPPRSVPPREF